MKRILILLFFLMLGINAYAAAPDITISSAFGFASQTINVPVMVDLTTPIIADQFNVQYDPNLLTFTGVSLGSATATWNILDNPAPAGLGAGNVLIGMYSATSITGSAQQIAILHFTVNATPGAPTLTSPNLILTSILFNETPVTSITNGNFTLGILGDVSGDGKVTLADAALALQYALGLTTLTPNQILAADVSKNGVVTVYDAGLIAEYAAGIITHF